MAQSPNRGYHGSMMGRARTALGCAALACAFMAPGADAHFGPGMSAARPKPPTLSSLSAPASVRAGATATVRGKVGRLPRGRAVRGRLTFTLVTSRKAKKGRALRGARLALKKGPPTRRVSSKVAIPASTPARAWFLRVCAIRTGARGSGCAVRAMRVTRAPAASRLRRWARARHPLVAAVAAAARLSPARSRACERH